VGDDVKYKIMQLSCNMFCILDLPFFL